MSTSGRRYDELGFVDLDILGDSKELLDQGRAMIAASAQKDEHPGAAYCEGADDTGSIRVAVDPQGRVQDVEVSDRWRDQLYSESFADSLFEAYTAAVQRSMIRVLRAVRASRRSGARGKQSATPSAALTVDSQVGDQVWFATTMRALDAVHKEIDHIEARQARSQPSNQERTVSSPLGSFTLRACGDKIVGIGVGDLERIQIGNSEQLRAEAIAVFRKAQQGSGG